MSFKNRFDIAEARRSEILSTAYKIFGEKGYHNTNIADIAKELDIGHGTFYRYFKNKLDIFTNVLKQVVDRISTVVAIEDPAASNTLDDYRTQNLRIANALFGLFVDDPLMSKIIFYEALGIDEEINRLIQQTMEQFAGITEKYLINGITKGYLRKDLNIKVSSFCINAIIFEGVRRIVVSSDPVKAKQEWTIAGTDFIIKGMQAELPAGKENP